MLNFESRNLGMVAEPAPDLGKAVGNYYMDMQVDLQESPVA